MDFIDSLKQFSKRVETVSPGIQTEEATKMSLIVPFFQLLGYDVFSPMEFCPEYTADVGIKKGEKVDYAILQDGVPMILVECKWCGESLDKHGSQLFRYFGTTAAKFGILTNGLIYKFYTDLEEPNKMDMSPFLEINLLDIRESLVGELKKFCKASFDKDSIFSTASELKYSSLIKELLKSEMDDPSDDFVRFILSRVYEGQKKQTVIDKFRNIVKKSMTSFLNEMVNQKITSALSVNEEDSSDKSSDATLDSTSKVVTTEKELEAYYIIRGVVVGIVDPDKVTFRDTESYFGILYSDNNRKPICRINFDTKQWQILIPDENKKFVRHYIDKASDIYNFKEEIIQVAKRYAEQ